MSLLSRSLIAFGLLLASFASPLGTAVAANTADESSLKEATTKCMQQDRDACASVGMAYYLGQNVAQNYSLATEYLTLACDLQDSDCCGLVGWIYLRGLGGTQNNELAVKFYDKACALQNNFACRSFGTMYLRGYGVSPNHALAAKYFAQSCELQYGPACIDLARMYEQGQGVEQNESTAAEYYAKGMGFMPQEERKNFFNEHLSQNQNASPNQEELQQLQRDMEVLREFSLESEFGRNVLQIQSNPN